MTYPALNGTQLGDSLPYAFQYANEVTYGFFGVFMVFGFFLTALISSLVIQFKFTSRIKPEHSFLASAFATLGFATILESYSGILNPNYFFIIIGGTILSFIWVVSSGE